MILKGEIKDEKGAVFHLISEHSVKHYFPLYFLYELLLSLRTHIEGFIFVRININMFGQAMVDFFLLKNR